MSSTYPAEDFPAAVAPAVSGTASPSSAVSWGAIIAGAVAAAAISVMLMVFGLGLGLSTVSPWPHEGVSAPTFTVLAAIWLIIVQWVSAGMGGYLSGRLRTKWVGVHTDEVFFRDTAHGFMSWSLATVIVVGMLVMTTGKAATTGTELSSASETASLARAYDVGMLFRPPANSGANGGSALAPVNGGPIPGLSDHDLDAQANTILAVSAANGGQLSPQDNAYLVQLVSERTGLSTPDAQARVDEVMAQEKMTITKAKQYADAARKASAGVAIYTFVSLLIGAFIASVAGAVGGRLRDTY